MLSQATMTASLSIRTYDCFSGYAMLTLRGVKAGTKVRGKSASRYITLYIPYIIRYKEKTLPLVTY